MSQIRKIHVHMRLLCSLISIKNIIFKAELFIITWRIGISNFPENFNFTKTTHTFIILHCAGELLLGVTFFLTKNASIKKISMCSLRIYLDKQSMWEIRITNTNPSMTYQSPHTQDSPELQVRHCWLRQYHQSAPLLLEGRTYQSANLHQFAKKPSVSSQLQRFDGEWQACGKIMIYCR